MATSLTEQLIEELKEWCGDIRGRRTEAAKAAGTSLQAVVDWFAKRRQPTAEQALQIQAFLKKRPRRRQSP
jgi:hypothetical protein